MYSLLRPLLFTLPPELAHHVTLNGLKTLHKMHLSSALVGQLPITQPHQVMGLTFPNTVGLAAGLDKNGDYVDALASLGFGFIEIGTLTPRPQAGNPAPRLFRLPRARALINRMGFNNKGIDYALETLSKRQFQGILGINIGKNKDTPLENALEDYCIGFTQAYNVADYVTVNISSPNTVGLRQLQAVEYLSPMLNSLKQLQQQLADQHGRYVPLVIKIAPDLTTTAINSLAQLFLKFHIDGVIATNTTLSRSGVTGLTHAQQTGGLSGAPLTEMATTVVKQLHQVLQDKIPIIAAGGIMNAEHVKQKQAAGATLVQVYTGLIYQGPCFIKSLLH